jgi:hypothetical protein
MPLLFLFSIFSLKDACVFCPYQEYMYDLLDVLVEKGTIELPKLCTSKIKNPKDAAKQVFIQKQTE